MENLDNPAKRLLGVLKKAKAMEPNMNCRHAWHLMLQTDNDESLLMSRLGKVMALPVDIQAAMQKHYPNRVNLTSHWIAQVNNAFASQVLGSHINSFAQHIDVHSINYLEMTSDLLESREQVPNLSIDSMASLRDRMFELLCEVLKSELAINVKDTITRYLRRLILSLDEYSITGAMPIVDAMESAFGRVAYDADYRVALKETPAGKSFVDVLAATANLVTVVVALPQLTDGVTHLAKLLNLG